MTISICCPLSLMPYMICWLLCLSQHNQGDPHGYKLSETSNFSIIFCFLLFSSFAELARTKKGFFLCVFWWETLNLNTQKVYVAKDSCYVFAPVKMSGKSYLLCSGQLWKWRSWSMLREDTFILVRCGVILLLGDKAQCRQLLAFWL